MIRLLSCLLFAGALAFPAVASAEPQYVYVHYGAGKPFLWVQSGEPKPQPPPVYVSPVQREPVYLRVDGGRFDSDVGAACGSLNTEVYFAATQTDLDVYDEARLAHLANCFSVGALAGVRIDLVAGYDGSETSLQRSYLRQRDIIDYLTSLGVRSTQLTISREIRPYYEVDRVRFQIGEPIQWTPGYRRILR